MSETPGAKEQKTVPPSKGEQKALVQVDDGLPPEIKKTIQQIAENPGVAVEPQKIEKALLAVMTKISFSYSRQGPLPHPQELAAYEQIVPGSAERIITSSEKQLSHRIALEHQTVTSQNFQSGRGQTYGFIIAIIGFLCAFGSIALNHPVAGATIGTVDLVALVSVFVLGKQAQRGSLAKKAKATSDPGEQ